MSWKSNFINYTSGTKFYLSLSTDMVNFLILFSEGGMTSAQEYRTRNGYDRFVPLMKSLEKRGLIEHNSSINSLSKEIKHKHKITPKWIYRLTEAGKLVVELLKIQSEKD